MHHLILNSQLHTRSLTFLICWYWFSLLVMSLLGSKSVIVVLFEKYMIEVDLHRRFFSSSVEWSSWLRRMYLSLCNINLFDLGLVTRPIHQMIDFILYKTVFFYFHENLRIIVLTICALQLLLTWWTLSINLVLDNENVLYMILNSE